MKRTFKATATLLFAFALFPLFNSTGAFSPRPRQAGKVDFVRDVQPIFQAHCAGCHGPQKAMSQLRLDNSKSAARVIAPGNGKDSRLMHRILGEGGEDRMPKGGAPLEAGQIDLIRRWIDEGATWPDSASARVEEKQKHWAFIAPARPALPEVKNADRMSSPVDRFILAALEKQGLALSPEADRMTLIRRLSLDLIGLPPPPPIRLDWRLMETNKAAADLIKQWPYPATTLVVTARPVPRETHLFKPGVTVGETDEIGFNVARDPVHVHDLHATILHLLGFDHEKLTYRFQGRDFRLTGVHGLVREKLLA